MSLPWISSNSNLQSGIALINQINSTKFNLLLQRITQAESSQEIFTPEELKKLPESLKISSDDVKLLILSMQHIYKQASKIITKPTDIQEQLIKVLKFNPDKAESFVKVWTETINKEFVLENSKKLSNISWELNLETASSYNSKELKPKARIQMKLVSVNEAENQNKEDITLELNEDELKEFYNVLEDIQTKLDSMI